ncbi:methyltransferase domain-containing protein [Brevundimonas sp.]|jgi:SAM-dependent methyltransferase|uniref:methyltransferase domain-containing protein n=1 Tax=Brevundimonas sp. TaxID=1871086 RepID=UPI002E0D87C1|nr:methyltransferase domain-containing protein [Brevundimonas sp.]
MTDDRDYLLGTHDAEVARLGLQHRVWRPRVLDVWRRAGITVGSTVIDAGAGPGWAALDLAEIVGPTGHVHALERSARFIEVMNRTAAVRGLGNLTAHEIDLVTDAVPTPPADAFWIRWVLAFVSDPSAVLNKLAAALRPGGVAVIHEYLDYGAFALLPDHPAIEDFKRVVVDDWRASGGEPDVGRALPALLPQAGLRLRSMRPIVDVVKRDDLVWQWPATWTRNYPRFLVEAGKVDQAWADRVVAALDAAESDPNAAFVTPMVIEIIAEKA